MIRNVQAWSLAWVSAAALALSACDASGPQPGAAAVTLAPEPNVAAASARRTAEVASGISNTPDVPVAIVTPSLTAVAARRGAQGNGKDASPAGGLGGHSGLGLTGSFPSDDVVAAGEHGNAALGHLRR